MTWNRWWMAPLLGALACCPAAAWAQAEVAELYGAGVHAYFSGNHAEAHEYLTAAIEQGSEDPRCFIFRGLAYQQLGRPDEARKDFEEGARLEAGDKRHQVSKALERVQGPVRLQIEATRRKAVLTATAQVKRRETQQFEESKRDEALVRRGAQPKVDVDKLPLPKATDPTDPFADAGAPPARPQPEDTASSSKPPATDDPFGALNPPMTDEASKQPSQPPAAKTDDPFADDPFGQPAPPKDAAPKQPEPPVDDPFGNAPVAPVEPAGDVSATRATGSIFGALFKAAMGDDPAGGAPPAQPPMDDPFGAPPKQPSPPMDDPFGAPPKQPAPPVENDPFAPPKQPAPPMDDPFGAPPKQPAPPVEDDPFAPPK